MARDYTPIIDRLWRRLWSGGIANPLTAIEQISYLIFLKRLDERDDAATLFADHEELRWEALKRRAANDRLEILREELIPFLRAVGDGPAFKDAMRDAVFAIPKASLVGDCIDALDELPLGSVHPDLPGDVYEDLLGELKLSGRNGQFRTPRHVIDAIVKAVDPRAGEIICDPAAGTAGFLVAAREHIVEKHGGQLPDENLLAYDFDASMVRLGVMNLLLHGVECPEMHYQDTLSRSFAPSPRVDVVLANPPFTGSVDESELNPDLDLGTTRTELLFLELARRMLRPGGRAGIIVPEGVLFGTSRAHVEVRRRWLLEANVQAIVSLPAGVFRPYTNVKTAILLAQAKGRTDRVWFCPVRTDGYTLDDRREPVPGPHDLAEMPAAVSAKLADRVPRRRLAKELAGRMWVASIEEIEQQSWSLAPSTYRERDLSAAAEPDPSALWDEVQALENLLREEMIAARRILDRMS